MPRDVTLDDVAREAAVSRATASRALNGRAGVKENVRLRIEAAAKRLGYRPNRAARNLAGGRAAVIGLALNGRDLRDSPYQAAIFHYVTAAADHRDEGLMVLTERGEPSEVVQRLLGDGLVDGVIVTVVALKSGWTEELLDAEIPTVLIGFHPERSDVTVVEVENRESSATVVGHLLDSGCKRVGALAGTGVRVDARDRLDGFRLAHERRSIPVDESLIVSGNFNSLDGYQQADQLIDNGADGVFAANDEMAAGVYRRAIERGLRIPEDLSIAGFDGHFTSLDRPGLSAGQPLLTSVVQPYEELAMHAVECLIEAIEDRQTPPNRILTPSIFYGNTTRPIT
ncbi:MAG: LacI family DNA-binding transcriptional regulator [Actinomycetota bacterium]